jgi:threonine synthase
MPRVWFVCEGCGREAPAVELYGCPACGGELALRYDYAALRRSGAFAARWQESGGLWRRFGSLLPQEDEARIVSLEEGSTPLLRSDRLAARLGVKALHFKLESCNPTGSFKDRQISVAMSKARELGRDRFGTASSGNVGVALSAYAARADARAYVWVSSSVAAAKRQQIQVYGARLFLTPENTPENMAANSAFYTGMQAFCLARGMVPMVTARSVNPYAIEGAKTVAYEVVASLGRVPDRYFAPVGGGGLFGSSWKGFRELVQLGLAERVPVMEGTQMLKGHVPVDHLEDPTYDSPTFYRPLDGRWAWQAMQATGGRLRMADPRAIRAAQADLARQEGIFAEPQGITAYAGLLRAWREGALRPDEVVVCVITGIGLKDMAAAAELCADPAHPQPHPVHSLAESAPFLQP